MDKDSREKQPLLHCDEERVPAETIRPLVSAPASAALISIEGITGDNEGRPVAKIPCVCGHQHYAVDVSGTYPIGTAFQIEEECRRGDCALLTCYHYVPKER